jgi:hypothetical protein
MPQPVWGIAVSATPLFWGEVGARMREKFDDWMPIYWGM